MTRNWWMHIGCWFHLWSVRLWTPFLKRGFLHLHSKWSNINCPILWTYAILRDWAFWDMNLYFQTMSATSTWENIVWWKLMSLLRTTNTTSTVCCNCFYQYFRCQQHLCPVEMFSQPICWDYDFTLQIPRLPHFLFLCDPFSVKFNVSLESDSYVINPGNFSKNSEFVIIYPLKNQVLEQKLPS